MVKMSSSTVFQQQRSIVRHHVAVGHLAMLHGCEVGENSLIGIGAIVLNKTKIGKNCLIGT
jgi:carbonic anhydrase/acetyltransferase-like protein (isoleucine patch superfamily)